MSGHRANCRLTGSYLADSGRVLNDNKASYQCFDFVGHGRHSSAVSVVNGQVVVQMQ